MFQKKRRSSAKNITVVLFVAIAISLFGFYEIKEYKDSVLDIYAQQQDAYVELVLDQINRYPSESDDAFISEILGSLNQSTNEYWTLAKNEQLLYVKDVMESNRYKGYSDDSYYISDSAKSFIENLKVNRITHAKINMDGERYVASGTKFLYKGTEYKICLLTYDKVILENNSFFQAQITISITIFGLVLLLLVTVMVFMETSARQKHRIEHLLERIQKQNLTIEELADQLAIETTYSASDNMFHVNALVTFLEKLEKRRVEPIMLVMIKQSSKIKEEQIVLECNQKLGKKYLKFKLGAEAYLFIFLEMSRKEFVTRRKKMDKQITILGTYCIEDDFVPYPVQYERFRKKVEENGGKTVFSGIPI